MTSHKFFGETLYPHEGFRMTVLLKPNIFSDCFPFHQPHGVETGEEFFYSTMCEDHLVTKKTLDPVTSQPGRPSIDSLGVGVPIIHPLASLKRQNPSPKPLGSRIKVVHEVTVSSDKDLLQNQESVLECLSPLLATSNAAVEGDKNESPRPSKKRRISTTGASCEVAFGKKIGTPNDEDNYEDDEDEDDATTDLGQGSSANEEDEIGLTDHQAAMWTKRFEELVRFREKFGHCLVPHKWSENLALATWVKRQRYQYKLREQGKRSTLTKERRDALDALDFVWDSHNAIWEERFNELVEFRRVNGHTSVPSTHKNHTLSVWVQCQRRQWKLMKEDTSIKDSVTYRIKQSRVERLEALGFVWEPRKNQQHPEASRKS